jgi:N-methylhydantoinase A/oxoprolinase/acetone carboxylase beta subunit
VAPPDRTLVPLADLRYVGQSFEIQVPWGPDAAQAFHDAHARQYGFSRPAEPVELVTARVHGVGLCPQPPSPRAHDARPHRPEPDGSSAMHTDGGPVQAAVFVREALAPGAVLTGPALVVEYSATTAVLPGWEGRVDPAGNLVIERRPVA